MYVKFCVFRSIIRNVKYQNFRMSIISVLGDELVKICKKIKDQMTIHGDGNF